MPKLVIPGHDISAKTNYTLRSEHNQISKTIEIKEPTRGEKPVTISHVAEDDEIVILQFEDGGEWVGRVDELDEIFGKPSGDRGRETTIEIPTSIAPIGYQAERGVFKEIKLKLIQFITGKGIKLATDPIAKKVAKELVIKADKHIMPNPGLFKVSGKNLSKFQSSSSEAGHYLLFLHGTLSSFDGSFGGLFDEDTTGIQDLLLSSYKSNILALNHYTLSESPFVNARQVLENLPEGSSLDIISHSRGGLIADILATCDYQTFNEQSEIYPLTAIETAMAEGHEDFAKELKALNKIAAQKKISIKKIIRVACPANGTVLLDHRLDHLLNGILTAIGLAFGSVGNPLYDFIKGFITDVIRSRADSYSVPGLLAMIEGSYPQQLINRSDITLPGQLIVIEGNAEFGGNIKHSIQVVLTNLYFRMSNDFVVNTNSMRSGMLRTSGIHVLLSKDDETSHFRYFKNKKTQQAIADSVRALPDSTQIKGFQYFSEGEDRGIVVGLFKKYRPFRADQISGNKPIVILIPGIMGTHLSVNGNNIWLDLLELGRGRMLQLAPENAVGYDYVIGPYYEELAKSLSDQYDVLTFGFDWRSSLSVAATRLKDKLKELYAYNQPIKIIAHSMGGLIVRDLMRLHAVEWSEYIERPDSNTILLGTPWKGSHLIIEAFTGYLGIVRQIQFLSTFTSKRKLLALYQKFEGMYELMPINDEAWEKVDTWEKITESLEGEKFQVPELLNKFKSYKESISKWNGLISDDSKGAVRYKNIYYVAGKADCTTSAYAIKNNRIKFYGTPDGDGSVTWQLGIPPAFPSRQLFYTHDTKHADLPSDTRLFTGIKELLQKGTTSGNSIFEYPPNTMSQRGTIQINKEVDLIPVTYDLVSNRSDEAFEILLNRKSKKKAVTEAKDVLDVKVVHGNLKYASYPVFAGHMQNEGITGSEVAIDHFLNGKLSERFSVKNYPARVGESLVLFDPALKPKGAIIIGAGEITEFNAYRLKRAVESGVINYAMHLRDNVNNKWLDSDQSIERGKFMSSISCLCIGTGFGRISMEDSLRAIITGIQSANEIIGSIKDLQKIVHVEFIELYEHIAQNIFYQLSLFKTSTDRQLNITLTQKEVGRKSGALKKFQFYTENSWWHNFTTRFVEKDIDDKNKVKKIPRLQFTSSSGIARVEEENTFTPNEVVDSLLKELSANPTWDKRSSKTLFELLIPYQFKDIIRQQNNILWKLDLQSAAYPWEMFHDHEQDEVPTFVTAGLIRQLYSFNSAGRKDIIRNKKALVIGDPDYTGTGLNQLPGAWNEALLVHQLLEASDFTSNLLPQHSKGEEVLNSLYNDEYKILHVSGHGVVEDEEYKTGVALSNNMMITPSMFGNLSRLPEFVFINCCSLGEIIPGKEKYFQERYKFAANIGTELIKIGVNAVIVAGWPVSDRAAVKFAESFYSNFLKGYQFGESVKRARKSCYDDYHESNNTWAAYQCYGDPWYRLTQSTGKDNSIPEYIAEDEVLADLYNIKSDTETLDSKPSASIEIKDRLEKIIKRAKNFSSGKIKEKEAEILSEIDDLEEAIKKLEELRKINKADYSIKAIEQYCNLRMKHLLTKRIKSTDKKGLASLAKEMKQIEKDFINLQLMGDTSERSSLMGSAYKKLATIRFYHKGLSKSIPSTAIYIEQAEKNYKAAYRLLDPNMLSQVVYPLTNWLQLHAINGWKEKINIDDKKQVDIYEYLVQKSKDLRGSFGKNIDFWEDISLVNLLQTTLYYVPRIKASKDNDVKNENKANQLKVIQELGKDITSHYISAWKDGGTVRQLQAEMEQTQFMLDMLISVKREVHWKSEMKKALNGIMKELQALRNEK